MTTGALHPQDRSDRPAHPIPPLVTRGEPTLAEPPRGPALVGPLTTAQMRRSPDELDSGPGPGPETPGLPAADDGEEPDASDAGHALTDAASAAVSEGWDDTGGWYEEGETLLLGETETEDELALVDLETSAAPADAATESVAPTHPSAAGPSDPARRLFDRELPVDDIAARLERIARTLRTAGPEASLAEHRTDPLGALIAGYLLGLGESRSGGDRPTDR
ncbi:MAG: hypothetical protein WD031_01390 [Gemmatimonadota bacterium]